MLYGNGMDRCINKKAVNTHTHTHTHPSGRLEKNRESVNVNTTHVAALLDRFCVDVLFYSQ